MSTSTPSITTKQQLQDRVHRLESEYRRAVAEVGRNGSSPFATEKEMRDEIASIYLGTIAALRRQIDGR